MTPVLPAMVPQYWGLLDRRRFAYSQVNLNGGGPDVDG